MYKRIKFGNGVLHIGVNLPRKFWGVSTRFDDDIFFYLGKVTLGYWWRTPNTRLHGTLRRFGVWLNNRYFGSRP